MTKDEKEALKTEHGNIPMRMVEVEGAKGMHVFVFKRPDRSDFDAWLDSDKTQETMRVMSQNCCVYPKNAMVAIKACLDEFPATLGNGIANAVLELAGLGKATVSPF